MPISDLLASISGKPGAPTPASTIVRPVSGPKRKADDDLRQSDPKAARVNPQVSTRPTPNAKPSTRPHTPSKPSLANGVRSGPPASTTLSNQQGSPKSVAKPTINGQPSSTTQNGTHRPASSSSTAPRSTSSSTTIVPKAAPKKGSFAEILARGRQAQAQMGHVGVIQHKKVEKGAVFNKKREGDPAPSTRPSHNTKSMAGGYTGNARPSQKGTPGRPRQGNGSSRPLGDGSTRTDRNSAPQKMGRGSIGPGTNKKNVQEPPKKFKKAATATTGYMGTSRPPPTGSSTKGREKPRGGALLSQPKGYSGSRSRSYGDDYDDDMDDFIDYDDEDDRGPRYDYASDGSSDMEAGLGDIDDEERRAEAIARREDIEEERLEKSLRVAKEERKRKALEELRARRR